MEKTAELSAVDAKTKTEPIPVEKAAEDLVEAREIQVIRQGQDPDHHWGLTLRNTARRISRLKGVCVVIPPAYELMVH